MPNTSVKISWNGAKLLKGMEAGLARGVFKGAQIVRERIQTNISVVGPPHSMPGEFPHLITGRLQDSVKIVGNAKKMEAKVVVEAPHAVWLEFGTSKMAPRPFIVRSMNEVRQEVVDAIVEESAIG